MTASQRLVPVISANDLFKHRYGRYLRWSTLAALALTAVGAWLMPRYQPTPYVPREQIIELIELPDPVQDLPDEKPLIAPQPLRPIEPTALPVDEPPDIPPTLGGPFYPAPVAGPDIHGDENFVASSSNPRLLAQPRPEYPEIMRMAGVEGVVVLKVLVGPDGLVQQAVVTRGVHPLLDRAALQAVWRCHFSPATQRTIPVRAWVEVPYRFRLH